MIEFVYFPLFFPLYLSPCPSSDINILAFTYFITLSDFLCTDLQEYIKTIYDLQSEDRGCKKSGIKRIRLHDLYYSHAWLLIELRFFPLMISQRLGHENIETTLNTYSHLYPNKHSQVAEKLQELFHNSELEPK